MFYVQILFKPSGRLPNAQTHTPVEDRVVTQLGMTYHHSYFDFPGALSNAFFEIVQMK